MTDTAAARETLETRRAEIEDRLARIERDLAEPLAADADEQAVQREDDEALEGQAAVLSRDLLSVRRALARIDEGSYGECMQCGTAISQQRLAARPEAALCIACARKG